MHICHVSPHLPPDQAANALLPYHLGAWAAARGTTVEYVAHPPRAGRGADLPGAVTWVEAPSHGGGLLRALRLDSLATARRLMRAAEPAFARADVVHIHSNGLLAEAAGVLARRMGKPTVLTLYGTEIWHYRRKWPFDLFTSLYRGSSFVSFYSQGLLDKAVEFGLSRPEAAVIYPPVAESFTRHDADAQQRERAALGITATNLLLNVKRLHPLAGQMFLIEAMPAVVAAHPDTHLLVCGTGPLAEALRDATRALGVADHVTFAGLVDNRLVARYCAAADAFVLPSLLEACPTVAVEALAAGTPVMSADHPGGVELNRLFGDDVAVVPREQSGALSDAIIAFLSHKRRTRLSAVDVLNREFRPAAVAARFWDVYTRLCAGH